MTRMIDADALNKKLCETTIFVKDGEKFQRMINDAPTIEPDADTISRSQAIKDISEWATDILHPDRLVKEDAIHILESLPSAEQVTDKLNNPDDSLLTADSEACKEQKNKLDLISRQDAVNEIHKYFVAEIDKTPTEIDEDGDELYADMPTVNSLLACNKELSRRIKSLPSAETPTISKKHQLSAETPTNIPTDLISRDDAIALVIKAIHGTDNEEIKEYLFDGLRKQMWSLPSAESTGAMDEAIQEYIKDGYMQPIGEDLISRQAVIELIKNSYYNLAENMDDVWAMVHDVEQLPSAPDSRQRGEWADNHNGTFVCDQCGCKHSKSNFCPDCGAMMNESEE